MLLILKVSFVFTVMVYKIHPFADRSAKKLLQLTTLDFELTKQLLNVLEWAEQTRTYAHSYTDTHAQAHTWYPTLCFVNHINLTLLSLIY